MFAVSQIILRNLDQHMPGGSALWINPQADDSWRTVRTRCDSLKLFSQDYGSFTFLQQTGAETEFSAFPATGKEKYDWVIINLPRQKALLTMMLDCAASLLAANGKLWLAGENRAGIKSADKLLRLHFRQVRKLDNARHCGLYVAENRQNEDAFDPLAYREKWDMEYADTTISVTSYPGVFAHGRLDEGTALLLDTLATTHLHGDVLDFACGAGVIGSCIAAHHADTRVTLLDTSALALRACEETLEANQLKASVLASDGLGDLAGEFDFVISNPPIHAGVKTDNRLGMRLLDSIHGHIRTGGRFILVANIHLPYENWLSTRFRSISTLAVNANKNYKIITAKK
ncbi:MAG: methyltransferase [Lysobacterales bacterium]